MVYLGTVLRSCHRHNISLETRISRYLPSRTKEYCGPESGRQRPKIQWLRIRTRPYGREYQANDKRKALAQRKRHKYTQIYLPCIRTWGDAMNDHVINNKRSRGNVQNSRPESDSSRGTDYANRLSICGD